MPALAVALFASSMVVSPTPAFAVTCDGGTVGAATGDNADATNTACGSAASATGSAATAVGEGANATGATSSAYGAAAQATSDNATATGAQSQASDNNATATGFQANAAGAAATATGENAQATAANATATGRQSIQAVSVQQQLARMQPLQADNLPQWGQLLQLQVILQWLLVLQQTLKAQDQLL